MAQKTCQSLLSEIGPEVRHNVHERVQSRRLRPAFAQRLHSDVPLVLRFYITNHL